MSKIIAKECQNVEFKLSLAERTVKRDVAAIQKMGLLVREGNTSAGHWVVIKEKE